MRVWMAIRVFFAALFSRQVAEQCAALLSGAAAAEQAAPPTATSRDAPRVAEARAPARSEAIALLAALQGEARFVDIVQEPLDSYSDAQIGAAARDVLRDCGKVLERFFAVKPLTEEQEGGEVEAPVGFDPGRFRLTGNVQGEPPFRGRLTHHGWEATRCELPQWSGSGESARVIAPLEIEVK